jgi:hypothetical protein
LAASNSLEEVLERELTCSFLPLPMEFFVTSQSTVNTPVNFGSSLSVHIIVIFDASGNVNVLRNSTSYFVVRCLTGNTLGDSSSSSLQLQKIFIAELLCVGLKQVLHIGLIHLLKSKRPGHVNDGMP